MHCKRVIRTTVTARFGITAVTDAIIGVALAALFTSAVMLHSSDKKLDSSKNQTSKHLRRK